MQAIQGRWRDVEAGMYVRDPKGVIWRVEATRLVDVVMHQHLLRNKAGETKAYTPLVGERVDILTPTEEEALATVVDLLGAEVVFVQDHPKKPGYCPPLANKLDDYHQHLSAFHHIWTRTGPGSRKLNRLIAIHETEHGPDGPQHIKNPTVYHRHVK